jgi:hypothetical protein
MELDALSRQALVSLLELKSISTASLKLFSRKLLQYAQEKTMSKTTLVQVGADVPSRHDTVTDMS